MWQELQESQRLDRHVRSTPPSSKHQTQEHVGEERCRSLQRSSELMLFCWHKDNLNSNKMLFLVISRLHITILAVGVCVSHLESPRGEVNLQEDALSSAHSLRSGR